MMFARPTLYAQLVIAIGVAVLIGWQFDIHILKSLIPGLVTMKANTALCFVLAGTSLLMVAPVSKPPGRVWAGRGLALLVLVIGALTLGEFLFGWQLAIDELLYQDRGPLIWTVAPGRMSLMTSIIFILCGLALLGIDWSPRRGWWPAEPLTLLVIILPVIALVEYFFAGDFPSLFFSAGRIAVHTSAAFVLLGLGILSARPGLGLLGEVQARVRDPLERQIYGAFMLALFTLLVLGTAAHYSANDSVVRIERMERSHEVRRLLGLYLSAHQEIQTGKRGYAIAGDEEFLQPYERGLAEAGRHYRILAGLNQGDPAQQARLRTIERLSRQLLEQSIQVVETRRSRGEAPALALIREGRGELLLEGLSDAIAEMDAAEKRSLDLQSNRGRRSFVRLEWTLLACVFFAVLILAFTSVIIYREFGRRQRAEVDRLRLTRELELLLESTGEGIYGIDLEGSFTFVNRAALKLLGYGREELLGRNAHAATHHTRNNGSPYPVETCPIFRAFRTAEGCREDNEVLWRKDGASFPAEYASHPIIKEGKCTGAVVTFNDITERKRAEATIREQNERLEEKVRERTAELQESEARLRTVVENLSEGVVVADLNGRLLHFNRAALAMHEFTSPEEYQRILPEFVDIFELRGADGSILPVGQWPLARILKGDTLRDLEIHIRSLKHDWRKIFSYGGSLVRDAEDSPLLAAVTMRDITKRKHAEQAILDLNATLEQRVAERTRQAEEANRAKSEFLANMSHELRTPLNAIIGFSEMLKDGVFGPLEERQRRSVADIFEAGAHLLALINDILDLSKVEAGALRLEAVPLDIAATLQASLLVVREKALKHRIRLDTRLDPALGQTLADERKLKQIAYNLLSNAVKFTPDGGAVTLSARRCARGEVTLGNGAPGRLIPLPPGDEAEFLEIAVADTGAGIAAEDLPRLFEPFSQVDSSYTRRHAGTGLGLSLVRGLAELHGGTVGVESRPGQGSRFRVWLPRREPPESIVAETAALPAPPAPRAKPEQPMALVIEDDDRMAALIEEQLHGEGYRVMRAATGEEGLVRAAKVLPQLITLDIFLPAMDGWEVMRRLKADPRLADTPVAIITVSPDLDHGLTLGARRILQKPFTREMLKTTLSGLIDIPHDGKTPRVLVVDDNPQTVDLVAAALEAEGYHVLRAYNGEEAIATARRDPPDLVILDLMMPGLSGFDVARSLRETERTAQVPILILTARDLTAEDRARLNGDVNAVLAKSSFDRSKLIAEIRRAMAPE